MENQKHEEFKNDGTWKVSQKIDIKNWKIFFTPAKLLFLPAKYFLTSNGYETGFRPYKPYTIL